MEFYYRYCFTTNFFNLIAYCTDFSVFIHACLFLFNGCVRDHKCLTEDWLGSSMMALCAHHWLGLGTIYISVVIYGIKNFT